MDAPRVMLRLTNDCSELERIMRAVDELGEAAGLAPKALFELQLAIEEHFTNIVHHGLEGEGRHEIEMMLEIRNGRFVVTVRDDGVYFNPLAASPPDLTGPMEERTVGNLGIHLIRKTMDDCRYERAAGKNVFIMSKNLGGH